MTRRGLKFPTNPLSLNPGRTSHQKPPKPTCPTPTTKTHYSQGSHFCLWTMVMISSSWSPSFCGAKTCHPLTDSCQRKHGMAQPLLHVAPPQVFYKSCYVPQTTLPQSGIERSVSDSVGHDPKQERDTC